MLVRLRVRSRTWCGARSSSDERRAQVASYRLPSRGLKRTSAASIIGILDRVAGHGVADSRHLLASLHAAECHVEAMARSITPSLRIPLVPNSSANTCPV